MFKTITGAILPFYARSCVDVDSNNLIHMSTTNTTSRSASSSRSAEGFHDDTSALWWLYDDTIEQFRSRHAMVWTAGVAATQQVVRCSFRLRRVALFPICVATSSRRS